MGWICPSHVHPLTTSMLEICHRLSVSRVSRKVVNFSETWGGSLSQRREQLLKLGQYTLPVSTAVFTDHVHSPWIRASSWTSAFTGGGDDPWTRPVDTGSVYRALDLGFCTTFLILFTRIKPKLEDIQAMLVSFLYGSSTCIEVSILRWRSNYIDGQGCLKHSTSVMYSARWVAL